MYTILLTKVNYIDAHRERQKSRKILLIKTASWE